MTDQASSGPTKKAGRPTGKRGTFTFRVTAELREKLEASAKQAERPVSEIIENRLEHTYWEDEYGKTLAGVWTNVLVSMSGSVDTARLVRDICALVDKIERDLDQKWSDNDFAKMVVGSAISEVISARLVTSKNYDADEKAYAQRNGHDYAAWLLRKPSPQAEDKAKLSSDSIERQPAADVSLNKEGRAKIRKPRPEGGAQ